MTGDSNENTIAKLKYNLFSLYKNEAGLLWLALFSTLINFTSKQKVFKISIKSAKDERMDSVKHQNNARKYCIYKKQTK